MGGHPGSAALSTVVLPGSFTASARLRSNMVLPVPDGPSTATQQRPDRNADSTLMRVSRHSRCSSTTAYPADDPSAAASTSCIALPVL